MSQRLYPEIPEGAVRLVIRYLSEDPDYLDYPDCPYPDGVKNLFRKRSKVNVEEMDEGDIDALDLEFEIKNLIRNLKSYGDRIGELEASEANTYFRISTSLLEKLVGMQERMVGVKRVRDFSDTVIRIMDDILTPDQRTKVMKQLQEVLDGEE